MNKNQQTNESGPHMTEKEARVHARTVNFFKKTWNWIQPYLALFIIVVLGSLTALGVLYFLPDDESNDSQSSYSQNDENHSLNCNVLGIDLHGMLLTYVPPANEDDPLADKDVVASQEIVSAIEKVQSDDSIKAILLEVDSAGGMPVAGEEIANALKASEKPTVAVIRQLGTSAAYWAATGADKIFASKNSDVGSIGVTMSYLENIGKDTKYVQLSSGKYKDAGNPDKPLTTEEKDLLMRDIKQVHENFIEDVAKNRSLSIEDVRAIADGSSVLGGKAQSLKLIDEIGSWSDAEKYLAEQIGEKPEVCW